LKTLLEAGFNGVRAHQKPPDPRYLYLADVLGILIFNEMADWGMSLKLENLEVFWIQWRNAILRDVNHPSIIAWVPFNERRESFFYREAIKFIKIVYMRTKNLDSTRFVFDTSRWTHIKTDIVDFHDYSRPTALGCAYSKMLSNPQILKSILEERVLIDGKEFLVSLPRTYKDQPVILSEFGG
jgi:beta-galactosidase/beta-glucuronidase